MKWEKVKLGKYVEILSGFAFKSKDFLNCGVPVIKIKNITQEGVTLEDVSYISKELADKNEKYHLNYNDILIALTGSHINQMSSVVGRIARVKYHEDSLLNQRVGKVFAKDSKLCDIDYVYYFLSQDYIKISPASKAGGAANQANISPNDVKSLTVRWPDIETQHRIANILSAYDDLIENNQKQIKLLEEAAQQLYKEWFVDLRFPGRENTKIVDGVPEGWNEKTLSQVANVIMGQSPKSEFYNSEKKGLPFHQGVGSYGVRFVMDDIYSTSYTRIAEPNSILFSVRAPVGRLNITKNKVVIGRGLAAINQTDGCQSYLYYLLKNKFFKDNIVGNGSIFASVSKDELLNQKFLIPERNLMMQFEKIASQMDKQIENLDSKNKKLIEARDRLLPKLMSGEVEV